MVAWKSGIVIFVLSYVVAVFVRLAVVMPPRDAAAGYPDAEGVGVMIAAVGFPGPPGCGRTRSRKSPASSSSPRDFRSVRNAAIGWSGGLVRSEPVTFTFVGSERNLLDHSP